MTPGDDRRGFTTGALKLGAALVFSELLVLAWMAAWRVTAIDYLQNGYEAPLMTRVVVGGVWFPAVIGGLAAWSVAAAFLVRPIRHRETLMATAVALGVLLILGSAYAMYMPIFELAGNIKAG